MLAERANRLASLHVYMNYAVGSSERTPPPLSSQHGLRFNVDRDASTIDLLLKDGFEPYYLSRTR
jgi:hypothetical protein